MNQDQSIERVCTTVVLYTVLKDSDVRLPAPVRLSYGALVKASKPPQDDVTISRLLEVPEFWLFTVYGVLHQVESADFPCDKSCITPS